MAGLGDGPVVLKVVLGSGRLLARGHILEVGRDLLAHVRPQRGHLVRDLLDLWDMLVVLVVVVLHR